MWWLSSQWLEHMVAGVYQEAGRMNKASVTKARGITTFKHTPILIYFHHDPGPSAFKIATKQETGCFKYKPLRALQIL